MDVEASDVFLSISHNQLNKHIDFVRLENHVSLNIQDCPQEYQ